MTLTLARLAPKLRCAEERRPNAARPLVEHSHIRTRADAAHVPYAHVHLLRVRVHALPTASSLRRSRGSRTSTRAPTRRSCPSPARTSWSSATTLAWGTLARKSGRLGGSSCPGSSRMHTGATSARRSSCRASTGARSHDASSTR
jgi:hypothetical protein